MKRKIAKPAKPLRSSGRRALTSQSAAEAPSSLLALSNQISAVKGVLDEAKRHLAGVSRMVVEAYVLDEQAPGQPSRIEEFLRAVIRDGSAILGALK